MARNQALALQEFLNEVARFAADKVAPAAADWSMGQSPDPEMFAQAAALGLFGIEVPEARGGLGLDFAARARISALLAAADFGFAMSVINTQNVALRLCQIASPTQIDRYLPGLLSGQISACTALTEPGAGSDFAAITTTARETPQGWLLNGEKTWIINGRHAGLTIAYAQCGQAGDAAGIGAFLIDLTAPGVTRHAIDGAFSQTGLGTGGFTLDNVELPADALLIAPGTAFKAIMVEINFARAYVAAMCNGMMHSAIDAVQTYGARRHSFGKPLNAIPSWQAGLDAARAALVVSEGVTDQAVQLLNVNADAQLAAASAKVTAATGAQRHLPELLQLMGAEGLRAHHPFTRHLAAAQIAGFTDGATNILKERVARLTAQQGG